MNLADQTTGLDLGVDLDGLDLTVDLDGCAYPWAQTYRQWVHMSTGRTLESLPEAQVWAFYEEQWGLSVDEFLSHFADGVNAGFIFTHGDPLEGSVDAIAALRAHGHRVHIVTDRTVPGTDPEMVATATIDWLDRHGITIDSFTVSRDKTVRHCHVSVDDRDVNYDALDAAGLRPYLLDRPWNRHHPGRRVHTWDEFVSVVNDHHRELTQTG